MDRTDGSGPGHPRDGHCGGGLRSGAVRGSRSARGGDWRAARAHSGLWCRRHRDVRRGGPPRAVCLQGAYAQGLDAIAAGAEQYGWSIDIGSVARIWRGGCIIRAKFLDRIAEAYAVDPDVYPPTSLLLSPYFTKILGDAQDSWRGVVARAAYSGIPTPGFAAALSHYDGLRAERLPAALIQGQRDFFGAHTYQRVAQEGSFHTLWSGDRTERRTA
jgi:hypothetical protein